MRKDNEIVLSIKRLYKGLVGSSTKVYLTTFATFCLLFGFVFISPSILGGSYSYENTPIYEYKTVTNNVSIALVKKEFNPEKEIMRLDYLIQETATNSSISNIEYDISAQDIKQKEDHKTNVIRVNDNYLVVIIEGVPEGFAVLSATIIPKYIHPEIQTNNDLEDRIIKTYINEEKEIINNSLTKQSNTEYEKEYVLFEQQSIEDDIKAKKDEIEAIKLKEKELNNLIDGLEKDLEFQTQEEKIETKNTINTHHSAINQYNTDIEEIEEEIDAMKEKIKLLEKKRASIK